MALFDRTGQDPLDPDPVRAHDGRHRLAVLIQHSQAKRFGVLVPELEDVPDLDRLATNDGLAGRHVQVSVFGFAQIREPRCEVASRRDAAKMALELVRAGHHIPTAVQGSVREQRDATHTDRAHVANLNTQPPLDLFRMRGTQVGRPPVSDMSFVSLSLWSPRSRTMIGSSSAIITSALMCEVAGAPSNALTSSIVFIPGVWKASGFQSPSGSGWVGGLGRVTAFSRFAL